MRGLGCDKRFCGKKKKSRTARGECTSRTTYSSKGNRTEEKKRAKVAGVY